MTYEQSTLQQRIHPGFTLVVTGFEDYETVTAARLAAAHNSPITALRNDP